MASLRFHKSFPRLEKDGFTRTSPVDPRYNCIAYALEDTKRWWWPPTSPEGRASFWPSGIANEETVEAFAEAFRTEGYEPCDRIPGVGYEVIALFAIEGRVTHAARRKSAGVWLSKLGSSIDIEHQLESLEGPAYGNVAGFYRRKRNADVPRDTN